MEELGIAAERGRARCTLDTVAWACCNLGLGGAKNAVVVPFGRRRIRETAASLDQMAIPPFTHDGVLPPFTGADATVPSGSSPYPASSLEVAITLGATPDRRDIVVGWIHHRLTLRRLGFTQGFQWLDGSFVESKNPNDVDVVTFVHPPAGQSLVTLMHANAKVFNPAVAKSTFRVDAYFVNLDLMPDVIVSLTSYWLGVFGHRRDLLWKGMVRVPLDDAASDAAALQYLGATHSAGISP